MQILSKLDELSYLARETSGAAFVIQHNKETGQFKVVFNNAVNKCKELKDTDFLSAIINAIEWLKKERSPLNTSLKYKL